MDELLTWTPSELLGRFRKVDSSIKLDERLQAISDWAENGGIIIIGYDMFRRFVIDKKPEKGTTLLSEEQHELVRTQLLERPNIIIADEAHKMKNTDASVTKAARQFQSRSRIALTGSPLANNVEEYHTMIDWVAPNYLGPIEEFRARFGM